MGRWLEQFWGRVSAALSCAMAGSGTGSGAEAAGALREGVSESLLARRFLLIFLEFRCIISAHTGLGGKRSKLFLGSSQPQSG